MVGDLSATKLIGCAFVIVLPERGDRRLLANPLIGGAPCGEMSALSFATIAPPSKNHCLVKVFGDFWRHDAPYHANLKRLP